MKVTTSLMKLACCHKCVPEPTRPTKLLSRIVQYMSSVNVALNMSKDQPNAQNRPFPSTVVSRLIPTSDHFSTKFPSASNLGETQTLSSFNDIGQAGPWLCTADRGQQLSVRQDQLKILEGKRQFARNAPVNVPGTVRWRCIEM